MRVAGLQTLQKFARKHADARKPLSRFLEAAKEGAWRHLPDLQASFSDAEYIADSGTVIFNIGGNKYRLVAAVDFEAQFLVIVSVFTHTEYDRRRF